MVNHVLAQSIMASTAVHAFAFAITRPPLPYTLFLTGGLAAGLWNHSTTSELAKWTDRGMMGVGTVITLLISPTTPLRLLMLLTVAAYAAGKRFDSVTPHLVAHWLITFINLHIMLSFQ